MAVGGGTHLTMLLQDCFIILACHRQGMKKNDLKSSVCVSSWQDIKHFFNSNCQLYIVYNHLKKVSTLLGWSMKTPLKSILLVLIYIIRFNPLWSQQVPDKAILEYIRKLSKHEPVNDPENKPSSSIPPWLLTWVPTLNFLNAGS